jgi:hypothetical protein
MNTLSSRMQRLLCLFMILLISFTGIQCNKDGDEQGPQGIAGPAGVPGSKIHGGTGAPAANLGAVDDYYLDRTAAGLYGPKTAAGWGTAVPLTGAAGTNGSQIHSGSGAPAAGTGVVGDFYFDRTAAVMYGPKEACSWCSGVALRIARVISYMVTRPSELTWNTSHLLDIGNSVLPIPAAIKENGVVLMYMVMRGTLTEDTWHQIPGHIFLANPAVNYYFIGTRIAPTYIRIVAYNEDGTDLPAGTNPPNANKLRVLLIPADEVNNIARKGSPADFKDYEAVKAAFHLNEDDAITIN